MENLDFKDIIARKNIFALGEFAQTNKLIENVVKLKMQNYSSSLIKFAFYGVDNKLVEYCKKYDYIYKPTKSNKELKIKDFCKMLEKEAEHRRKELLKLGYRNFIEYEKFCPEFKKEIPTIFIVINNLTNLKKFEIEYYKNFVRFNGSLSRLNGMQFLFVSNEENINYVFGSVKACCINRICFKVEKQYLSKFALDVVGAEKLEDENEFIAYDGPEDNAIFNVDEINKIELEENLNLNKNNANLTFKLRNIKQWLESFNLKTCKNILIGGPSGSGKTKLITHILNSISEKSQCEDVKFALIDAKFVELNSFDDSKFLYAPIATNFNAIKDLLNKIKTEINNRLNLFKTFNVSSINEFNNLEIVENGVEHKLPYVVLAIDEITDLMVYDREYFNNILIDIAKKCNECGIYLICGTQSVNDYVENLSKEFLEQFNSRITFGYVDLEKQNVILGVNNSYPINVMGKVIFRCGKNELKSYSVLKTL